jgi:LacI family transcriptional regulator
MAKTTMRDIARKVGVSQTTVSFTLSGKADRFGISPETQQRIMSYVTRTGYVPDIDAANVAGREVRKIGIVVPNVVAENHGMILFKLTQHIPLEGGVPLICSANQETFVENIRYLAGKKAGDIMLVGSAISYLYLFPDVHSMLNNQRVYLVDFPFPKFDDEKLPLGNVIKIGIDRARSYREAVALLANLGHRRIAAASHAWHFLKNLPGPPENPELVQMRESYHGEDYFAMGRQILPEVLRLMEDEGCTAVMMGDDQVAIGLISALLEAGRSVPRDISVLGFDNIDVCPHVRVPLSTIDLPRQEMIDIIMSDLFVEKDRKRKYVLNGKVILRESVGIAPQ